MPAQGTAKTAEDVEAQNLSELKVGKEAEADDGRADEDAQSAANADEVD